MKTSLRLFLAGAIGALIGGGFAHRYIHGSGFWAGVTLVTFIALSGFVASLLFDPQGTFEVTRGATKKAWPALKDAGESIVETIAGCWSFSTRFLLWIVVTSLSAASWLLPMFWVSVLLDSASGKIATLSTLSSVGMVFVGMMSVLIAVGGAFVCVTIKYIDKCFTPEYAPYTPYKTHAEYAFKASMYTSSIAICVYLLMGVCWMLKNAGKGIYGLGSFIVMLVYGLSQCQLRTAAMAGAGIGTLIGFYHWNPLVVCLAGGLISVASNAAAHKWADSIKTEWLLRKEHPFCRTPAQTETAV